MNVVHSFHSAYPATWYPKEEICAAAGEWLAEHPSEWALFQRFMTNSRIRGRSFAIAPHQIVALDRVAEREAIFRNAGTALGVQAATCSLEKAGLTGVTALIFTSCSAPVIPSIDAEIAQRLGFLPGIRRIPLFQHGCVGGAFGLSLANQLVCAAQGEVLVLSVELCSLVHQHEDLRGSSLVGSALFGDGSAACIISSEKPPHSTEAALKVIDAQSYLIPESTHLMGYDLSNSGLHLRLDRTLPRALAKEAPSQIVHFLKRHGLSVRDIPWWLFHPGGVKVLHALEEILTLSPHQDRWSWQVLEERGNMSSATILVVTERFLAEGAGQPGDKVVIFGVGPGLTLEMLLLEIC